MKSVLIVIVVMFFLYLSTEKASCGKAYLVEIRYTDGIDTVFYTSKSVPEYDTIGNTYTIDNIKIVRE